MSSATEVPRDFGEWMNVLAHIEATLQQSLALAADPPASPGPREDGERVAPLRALDERLARWQARLDLAEHNATEAGSLLEAEARALEDWAQALAAVEERLANCTRGSGSES